MMRRIGAQHQHSDDQTRDDLEEDLQHLVHGGGEHVAVALTVAAVGGDHAHQQYGRGHGPDAGAGVGVFQIHGGEPVREKEHHGREDKTQDREARQRDAEGLLLLFGPAVGVGLRYKAGQRHGQTRGGEGEEDVVDAVGTHEHGVALVPEDVAQGDLVEEAEDLHDDDADGQDGRAVHIVLSFGF